MLGGFPTLPINIQQTFEPGPMSTSGVDNIVASLKHGSRVFKVKLDDVQSWPQFERLVTEMQRPFPELDHLDIRVTRSTRESGSPPVVPDSFLGGSAPRLAHLRLQGVPFPGLPKLLLSAKDLVDIRLWYPPGSGYFSPEAITNGLSAVKQLRLLDIAIGSSPSRQESQRPHPVTRIALPALIQLKLECTCEYLEDLVDRIDAPSLATMEIFSHPVFSNFSKLPQFISRIEAFMISDQAHIFSHPIQTRFTFSQRTRTVDWAELLINFWAKTETPHMFKLPLYCSSVPPHSAFERLVIQECRFPGSVPVWDMENELQELSSRFAAVKNLFLDINAVEIVGSALKRFPEESMTQVFPALQNVFVEALQRWSPNQQAIWQFTSVRQIAGQLVLLRNWERKG